MADTKAIKLKGWVARDKNDYIHFYLNKPYKDMIYCCWWSNSDNIYLPHSPFKNVKWTDKKPLRVEIEIKEIK